MMNAKTCLPLALLATVCLVAPALAKAPPSSPELGKAEGRCRADEPGPALLVNVAGLKDRRGLLKLEVYPANEDDFLQDDNVLVAAGKTFRRVEIATPPGGAVTICVRVPGPGTYAVMVLHDRDGNHKIGLSVDGFGVAVNPHFHYHKPRVDSARVVAGAGLTRITVTMAYRSGLFTFDPIK